MWPMPGRAKTVSVTTAPPISSANCTPSRCERWDHRVAKGVLGDDADGIEAFGRGLHFMCEKPFADTVEHAREMLQLAEQSKRRLLISQNYRYRPVISRAKQLLEEKIVGPFGHGHIDFYIPADFTGTYREKMDFPLLVDMAIHHMDLIRYVTGRNIVKVTTLSFQPDWSWYAHHAGL